MCEALKELFADELAEREEMGIEKGIEKGIQQGRQEERQEFALRLLSKGMSREDVAEMANLPLAEIDKVINLI